VISAAYLIRNAEVVPRLASPSRLVRILSVRPNGFRGIQPLTTSGHSVRVAAHWLGIASRQISTSLPGGIKNLAPEHLGWIYGCLWVYIWVRGPDVRDR
jgi:hypothetical protein